MTASFTPFTSLLGGALIGLSASLMLLGSGRVAGISGIAGGLLTPQPHDVGWRVSFLAGLIAAGALISVLWPGAFVITVHRPTAVLALAGVLVGFGTRLGNGCTSGHGVCGLSRLSPRSLAATLTFMAAGALTAVLAGALEGS